NTVTITKGKLEIANGVTLNSGYTINTGDAEKTMIGGRGTLNKAVTIGSANSSNFVDVISPGDGISSSISSSSTQQQVSLGERTNAIGTFTVSDNLTLAGGGVYDWEISDFTNAGNDTKAGVDWDLLKFDTLTYDPNDTFTINVMGLAANGTAGAMSGGSVWGSFQEAGGVGNGFKFMEFTGTKSWSGDPGAGTLSNFSIQDDGWQYYNSHHLNEWSVYWDGTSAFYLQYSAVPEPSTYMMVTGLLMVPGMSYVRRLRRKKNGYLETEK
ncbi:MAG: PEP-CTERM sorting domain-containing protein, partial [Opitutales bacterium]|nr:PEP-CTERM sorting domain-containing protein [Opitutales bacterium]